MDMDTKNEFLGEQCISSAPDINKKVSSGKEEEGSFLKHLG